MKVFCAFLFTALISTSAHASFVSCNSKTVQAAFEFIPVINKDGSATLTELNGSIIDRASSTQTTFQTDSIDASGSGDSKGYAGNFQFNGILSDSGASSSNDDDSSQYSSSSSSSYSTSYSSSDDDSSDEASRVPGMLMMVPKTLFGSAGSALQIHVFLSGNVTGPDLVLDCSVNDLK